MEPKSTFMDYVIVIALVCLAVVARFLGYRWEEPNE